MNAPNRLKPICSDTAVSKHFSWALFGVGVRLGASVFPDPEDRVLNPRQRAWYVWNYRPQRFGIVLDEPWFDARSGRLVNSKVPPYVV